MNRKLVLLNLALLALVATLVWVLRVRWQETQQRESEVLRRSVPVRATIPLQPVAPVAPARPTEYIQVAQQTLFSKDRNPNIEVPPPPTPPPPPPMPPLPAVHGTMNLFGDHVVILSSGQIAQKSFRTGDQIGQFKIVSFDNEKITLEWDGGKVERTLRELAAKDAPSQAAPTQRASGLMQPPQVTQIFAPAPAPSTSNEISTKTPDGSPQLGVPFGGGQYACVMGDKSPAGTVNGNFRKVIATTMMGPSCHWEPIK
jgi:hypothetical protein